MSQNSMILADIHEQLKEESRQTNRCTVSQIGRLTYTQLNWWTNLLIVRQTETLMDRLTDKRIDI